LLSGVKVASNFDPDSERRAIAVVEIVDGN